MTPFAAMFVLTSGERANAKSAISLGKRVCVCVCVCMCVVCVRTAVVIVMDVETGTTEVVMGIPTVPHLDKTTDVPLDSRGSPQVHTIQ